MKIAVDVYGGDNSPNAAIDGAVEFLKTHDDKSVEIILTGDESVINSRLSELGYKSDRLIARHAPDEITCHDKPVDAVRKKKESSMAVAIKMAADGEADAVVSSGSTGALLAGATLVVKRIRGIKRPALTPLLPTVKHTEVLLIDSGANSDCTAEFLAQFALMGSCYMKAVKGIENPRVALLSNGTEDEKGTDVIKEANALIRQLPINFVGNCEGRDILLGDIDVCVCDGFSGNIALKSIEGTIKAFSALLKETIMSSFKSKIGGLLIKSKLNEMKKTLDYRETGGAPFLGVNGCVIKAHGSSNDRAFCRAIEQAYKYCKSDVVKIITEETAKQTAE